MDREVGKRSPDILHTARKSRSLSTRSCFRMSDVCRLCACFPAVMGHRLYWYRSFPDPLLQVLLVPAMFSAARLLLLEGPKMSEHGRKMHKPREPGTVRNRPEPFLTVPDRSWHTACQITYLQCCKIVFHDVLATVAACQERSGTVPNGSCLTWYGFTTIYRVFLAHG